MLKTDIQVSDYVLNHLPFLQTLLKEDLPNGHKAFQQIWTSWESSTECASHVGELMLG